VNGLSDHIALDPDDTACSNDVACDLWVAVTQLAFVTKPHKFETAGSGYLIKRNIKGRPTPLSERPDRDHQPLIEGAG
jgi:hypothetical protein